MKENGKTIYVYDDFSEDTPVFLGTLYSNTIRGKETYSFEYDKNWLTKTNFNLTIDPGILTIEGIQYPDNEELFGVFKDTSPDRWGRTLMNRRERILAAKQGRKPAKLYETDYLLGVSDEIRVGGIRFKFDKDGQFISDDDKTPVPPWTTLRYLEDASVNYEKDENSLNEKWLKQLIKPGSSLGGARPKATVKDPDGNLWIAKFPSKNDENDTGAWEMVAHDLAVLCGLNVPEARLEKFSSLGSTFLVKRFDRFKNKRIHFASAMTLLKKSDGSGSADGVSYTDIADFIKSYGSDPKNDLLELWKRIVFNMAITNSDDHLRNHAFILQKEGWKLSPAYDINPVPYGNELSLNVDEYDNTIDINLPINISPKFGINTNDAKNYADEILDIVKNNWKDLAIKYGITHKQTEDMRPAFQVCYK